MRFLLKCDSFIIGHRSIIIKCDLIHGLVIFVEKSFELHSEMFCKLRASSGLGPCLVNPHWGVTSGPAWLIRIGGPYYIWIALG